MHFCCYGITSSQWCHHENTMTKCLYWRYYSNVILWGGNYHIQFCNTNPSSSETGPIHSLIHHFFKWMAIRQMAVRWKRYSSLHTRASLAAFGDCASLHRSSPMLPGDRSMDNNFSYLLFLRLFPFAKSWRQKQQLFFFKKEVNLKSGACWLRLGLSTVRLMNSPGLSDKLRYQRVNLVEKKIYLSFLVTASEAELATGIYFLNSEQLGGLLWPLLSPLRPHRQYTSTFHCKPKMFTLIHHRSQLSSLTSDIWKHQSSSIGQHPGIYDTWGSQNSLTASKYIVFSFKTC